MSNSVGRNDSFLAKARKLSILPTSLDIFYIWQQYVHVFKGFLFQDSLDCIGDIMEPRNFDVKVKHSTIIPFYPTSIISYLSEKQSYIFFNNHSCHTVQVYVTLRKNLLKIFLLEDDMLVDLISISIFMTMFSKRGGNNISIISKTNLWLWMDI